MTISLMDGNTPIFMPTKTAAVRGEWWIVDGSAEYADGDIGDQNHETVVLDHIRMEFGYFGEGETWEEYLMRMGKDHVDTIIAQNPEIRKEALMDFDNYPMSFIEQAMEKKYSDSYGEDDFEQKWAVANDKVDLREYAIKTLGWIRVAGRSLQLNDLQGGTITNLVRGLGTIFEEEGVEEGMEGNFDMEVISSKQFFSNVPYEVIREIRSSGDPMALATYKFRGYSY